MSLSRYAFSKKLGEKKFYTTAKYSYKIHQAAERNLISFDTIQLSEKQRLDHISFTYYKDSSFWWIIAAASGIGWGLQVPPGTLIRVPRDINEVFNLL